MKIPVVQREAYTIYLERYLGHTFVHCDVFKWSKTSKTQLHKDWETLCLLHSEPIHAYHVVGDKKHLKFLETYGFVFVTNVIGSDLRELQIFRKDVPYGN